MGPNCEPAVDADAAEVGTDTGAADEPLEATPGDIPWPAEEETDLADLTV